MWDTYDQWWFSNYPGRIAIRTKVRGGRCDYLIPKKDVASRYQSFISDGYHPSQIHFSAQCPEEDKIIQGEVQRGTRGLELTYSRSVLPMRDALRTDPHHATGMRARILLQSAMCSQSFDWLHELLDRFENHVVEFTTLRYPWGVLPGFNTVFWEVRNY